MVFVGGVDVVGCAFAFVGLGFAFVGLSFAFVGLACFFFGALALVCDRGLRVFVGMTQDGITWRDEAG